MAGAVRRRSAWSSLRCVPVVGLWLGALLLWNRGPEPPRGPALCSWRCPPRPLDCDARHAGRGATAARAIPLRGTEGVERLAEAGSEALFLVDQVQGTAAPAPNAQVAELEAALPELTDLDGLSELMIDGFSRILQPRLLKKEKWGPIAAVWNALSIGLERQVVRAALGQNMQMVMLRPSIGRPLGRQFEGHGLGLMLVPKGSAGGPPVAFCELCVMVPDGRRPDDASEIMQMILSEPVGREAEPYLLNFCVAEKYRRCGVGRALLRLAEDVVADVWGGDRLYLHTDGDEAAVSLYASAGYVPVNGTSSARSAASDASIDSPVHMVKQLPRRER